MTTMNLRDIMSEAEKEMRPAVSATSDWFKVREGNNRIRLLSTMVPYASHFNFGACLGKEECPVCKEDDEARPSVKFLVNVLDYSDNEIKIAQLPYTIAKAIQEYQDSEEYSFDSAPMPYDITIKATKAGTKEVEYNVMASPKRTDVPTEVLTKLEKKHTPEQVKDALKAKKRKELGLQKPEEPIDYPKNEGEIPF